MSGDEDGSASSNGIAEFTGAFDHRLELRHDRPRSPGVEATLVTRLRIELGLTRLSMLFLTEDRREPLVSEVCRTRLIGFSTIGLEVEEEGNVVAEFSSLLITGICDGLLVLELFWPMTQGKEGGG